MVPASAIPGHMRHGDIGGACVALSTDDPPADAPPPTPDSVPADVEPMTPIVEPVETVDPVAPDEVVEPVV